MSKVNSPGFKNTLAKVPSVVAVQEFAGANVVVVPASFTYKDCPVAELAVALAILTKEGVVPVTSSRSFNPIRELPDTNILLFNPVVPVVNEKELPTVSYDTLTPFTVLPELSSIWLILDCNAVANEVPL